MSGILHSVQYSAFCILYSFCHPSSADVPLSFLRSSFLRRSFVVRSFVRCSFVRCCCCCVGVGIGVNGATPTLRRRGRFDFVDAGVAVWRSGECLACAWGWMDGHESA